MPSREELEDIMNNKPYGYGRRVITKKLKKYEVRTEFVLRLKQKIMTKDVVLASSVHEACYPEDDLKNALEKKRELEEQYPDFWVTLEKRCSQIRD